jgi:hypothetical protein
LIEGKASQNLHPRVFFTSERPKKLIFLEKLVSNNVWHEKVVKPEATDLTILWYKWGTQDSA